MNTYPNWIDVGRQHVLSKLGVKQWPTTMQIAKVTPIVRADQFVDACRIMRHVGRYELTCWVRHTDVIQLDVAHVFPGNGLTRVHYAPVMMTGSHVWTPNPNILAVTDPDESGFVVIELGCPHSFDHTVPYEQVDRYECTVCGYRYDIDRGD